MDWTILFTFLCGVITGAALLLAIACCLSSKEEAS